MREYETFETIAGAEGSEQQKKCKNDKRWFHILAVVGVVALVVIVGASLSGRIRGNDGRSQLIQTLDKPYVSIMGASSLNKAYNMFRGRGLNAAYARSIGRFTMRQKKMIEFGSTVYFQPDQIDVTTNAQCINVAGSKSVFASASVEQAIAIGKSSTASLGAGGAVVEIDEGSVDEADGTTKAPGGSIDAVGGSFALSFGNSWVIAASRSFAAAGYGHTAMSSLKSLQYEAFIDWKTPNRKFSFSKSFLAAVKQVNRYKRSPKDRVALVAKFFNRYGSHVVKRASFGAKCEMSIFMGGHATAASMSAFLAATNVESIEFAVFGASEDENGGAAGGIAGSATTAVAIAAAEKRSAAVGLRVAVGAVKCSGELEYNMCLGKLSAPRDDPVMIDAVPMPIWEVAGAGFNAQGKKNIHEAIQLATRAFLDCRKKHCDGKGYCTFNDAFWESLDYSDSVHLSRMFGPPCVLNPHQQE